MVKIVNTWLWNYRGHALKNSVNLLWLGVVLMREVSETDINAVGLENPNNELKDVIKLHGVQEN